MKELPDLSKKSVFVNRLGSTTVFMSDSSLD